MHDASRIEMIPLGGLGEFGMNMMLYRRGSDAILVDAGMMFPGSEHLGVDVVIPDLSYLEDCGTIHGVVLTHGHEDHIGALPFVLAEHDLPVYATAYTRALVRRRLKEHDLADRPALHDLPENGGTLSLGPFEIETVRVAHSIPQAVMLVLRCDLGTVVHTADFKLDAAPPDGRGTDVRKLGEIGREGVLALLSDSTNADRPGVTPGEATVAAGLDACFAAASRRVFVTTFASNIQRVQQIIDVSERHGRRVALVGASVQAHAEVARSLGLLRFPDGARCDAEACMDLPPEEVTIVATGSQGEPMSAMARISVDKHRDVAVEPGDVVVHSARVIPGNEKSIGRMIDHLLRRGAEVVTAADAPVHVSGHASRDELRIVLDLLRPKFLVPIHGEYRQLKAHAMVGAEAGLTPDRIVLADSGDVIALDERGCRVVGTVPVGQRFIDASLEPVDRSTLKDRRRLAYDGTVVAVVAIDRKGGGPSRPPELVARGFVGEDVSDELLGEASDAIGIALEDSTPEERTDEGVLRARVHAALKRFFRRRVQRRPLIIPVIVEF